ncbi:hypothetical protein Zmor_027942 [Zophobas morio]|uniref:THAP domain-containing protein 9 n=1 Tax=Zophobas morio TaxID=2755281 RepID=A0AA38M2I8_9CUCU|nr:hypothetical protein Zmor_027942 [Zophobas morio]
MKVSTEKQYEEELRVFALTLNFYSTSAYNYIRKTFAKSLPHPKTLEKWYRAVDGSPGYTRETLRAVEIKVKEMRKENKLLVCGLIMDEMSIRQHVQWNGKRQTGYINYGFRMDGDGLPVAKNALVFLLVSHSCKWKIPVGYFLINGLNAQEKATLVNGCLTMLSNVGVTIVSLTFDGAAANLSMAYTLGVDIYNYKNLRTYFLHPLTKEPIFIILDACHMIKLIRNALADWGVLYNGDNNPILWQYFVHLVELQEKCGLHAATKIRRRHINYEKNREVMKVKLATQVFSISVSDALKYCCLDLQLEQFQNAVHTAEFCLMINNIFDLMNTRNSLSTSMYKKSLTKYNNSFLKKCFNNACSYISNLKDLRGQNILVSSRKTGFLGLLVNMKSIEGIVDNHIINHCNIKYLYTYKLSQDHLEMFFSNIRARGGFTNNPTAIQFEAAYKKILIHTELSSSEAANCLALDETSILKVVSTNKSHYSLDLISYDCEDDEELNVSLPQYMEKYIFDVVQYIAGFIVKKLKKTLKCDVCLSALITERSNSSLLNRKNRGGLIHPSHEVIKLCRIAETIFRCTSYFYENNIIDKLVMQAARKVNIGDLFKDISEHIKIQPPRNNHLIQLMYLIFKYYFCIRLNHRNKSLQDNEVRVRHVYTKLIHFKHQ